MKTYIGIDPGKHGAIARIIVPSSGDPHIETWNMPETERDMHDLFLTLRQGITVKAIIEKVWGMPGMGGTAMFAFGKVYGQVRMAMICNGIAFDEVIPQSWQKAFGIPPKKKTETKVQHKNKLKAKAQMLFPTVKITLANADAILICEHLRRIS